MTERKFGRLESEDPEDFRFSIRQSVAPSTRSFRYWNTSGWWGDQGTTPQCVGYAWAHWLEDGPVTQYGTGPIVEPTEIYKNAQKLDQWYGEDYEGTSVRAGAKYLQQLGYISEYKWGWTLQELIDAVLSVGPCVVGTMWYRNMMEPDKSNIVYADGDSVGGHAYVINGVNVPARLFRIKNSWGRGWGNKGMAFISFDDMEKLINQRGEICLAIEKKKV